MAAAVSAKSFRLSADLAHVAATLQKRQIVFADFVLQAYKRDVGQIQQRLECCQPHRTVEIVVVRRFTGPNQSDTKPPLRQARPPKRNGRVGWRYVGVIGRYRLQRGAASQWQAEQRTVEIVVRQRLLSRNHCSDPLQA